MSSPQKITERLHLGLRKPANWLQLMRFSFVGLSGYAVNLAVFAIAFRYLQFHHLLAATVAFLVAVTNNFFWNRHWTFRARDGHFPTQARRFVVVSTAALSLNLALLEILVSVIGIDELLAQAVAVACATPVSFLGNKLWSFRV